MPITEKQLQANRTNATKSTGPRSPEGKSKVSHNALTHGLTSRRPLVLPHQQDSFDQLSQSLHAEVQPWGALETDAYEQLLHAAWQLRRADEFEAATWAPEAAPDARLTQFERLTRLRGAIERSYQRAYRRLRELQTTRSAEDTRSAPAALNHAVTTPLAACPREKKQTHFFPEPLYDEYLEVCRNPATYVSLPYRALHHLHRIISNHPRLKETPADPTLKDVSSK